MHKFYKLRKIRNKKETLPIEKTVGEEEGVPYICRPKNLMFFTNNIYYLCP